MRVTSSNSTLVPTGNLVLGGSGANRTLTITPAANQNGTATITVEVTDGATITSPDVYADGHRRERPAGPDGGIAGGN